MSNHSFRTNFPSQGGFPAFLGRSRHPLSLGHFWHSTLVMLALTLSWSVKAFTFCSFRILCYFNGVYLNLLFRFKDCLVQCDGLPTMRLRTLFCFEFLNLLRLSVYYICFIYRLLFIKIWKKGFCFVG